MIQSQDDPSVSEVVTWVRENGLRLYSCYPPVLLPLLGDSIHHRPKFDPYTQHDLFSITELTWMMQTDSDADFLPAATEQLDVFASSLTKITDFVRNFNKHKNLDAKEFLSLSQALIVSSDRLAAFVPLRDKLCLFVSEAEQFVSLVKDGDLVSVRQFIEKAQYLFKGACGVRHVDFIAYKPD